jgi:hypothetical protein
VNVCDSVNAALERRKNSHFQRFFAAKLLFSFQHMHECKNGSLHSLTFEKDTPTSIELWEPFAKRLTIIFFLENEKPL